MYEHFEHTADLGLRVRAPDLHELFADAGRGLFAMIVPDLGSIELREEATIEVEGGELDYLLFDWLSELLYLFDTRQLLLAEFDVRIEAAKLTATVRGEPVDLERHRLEHEVKAITYHGLKVERDDDGWLAEVIVDI